MNKCANTMADNDEYSRYRRRRMAGARVVLGCLAITFGCTYFIHSNNPSTVGFGIHAPSSSSSRSRDLLHRWRRRRRLQYQSSTSIKRVRSHSVSIEIAEEDDNDNRDAAIRSSKSNGGITARDSNGLLIEIAPRSQSSSNENADSKQTDASSSSSFVQPTFKIINGSPHQRPLHPYIVRIHWTYPGSNADTDASYNSFCGGSLISPNVILTAAHCLGKYEKYVDIYSSKYKRPITHRVKKSVLHPKYESDYFGFDYGLILIENAHLNVEVETATTSAGTKYEYWGLKDVDDYDWEDAPPIVRLHRYSNSDSDDFERESTSTTSSSTATSNNVPCSTLTDRQSKETGTLTVIGYGMTKYGSSGASDQSYTQLQGADVHYMLNSQCNEQYLKAPRGTLPKPKERGMIITQDMLCAWDVSEGQDACSGDSGGPLLAKVETMTNTVGGAAPASLWTQVGVVSWGIGCASSQYPGVYSRVAYEIDWIEEVICDERRGLSPLSCVLDESTGVRHLRDYTLEAAVRKMESKRKKKKKRDVRKLTDASSVEQIQKLLDLEQPQSGAFNDVQRNRKRRPSRPTGGRLPNKAPNRAPSKEMDMDKSKGNNSRPNKKPNSRPPNKDEKSKKKKPSKKKPKKGDKRQNEEQIMEATAEVPGSPTKLQQQGVGRDKVQLFISSSSTTSPRNEADNRSQSQLESCELLEGDAHSTYDPTNADRNTPPDTPSPTQSPTPQPTKPPSDTVTVDDSDSGRDEACPANKNQSTDVKFFYLSNNSDRKKSCKWVRKKCTKRCGEYSTCCPETCSTRRCQARESRQRMTTRTRM